MKYFQIPLFLSLLACYTPSRLEVITDQWCSDVEDRLDHDLCVLRMSQCVDPSSYYYKSGECKKMREEYDK